MPDLITDNIKTIAGACVFLVGIGMGWSELSYRLQQKADRVEVESVARELSDHLRLSANEWRVNRVLLCRVPEIRPDSYCEGFR